jgi:hypothetical protein
MGNEKFAGEGILRWVETSTARQNPRRISCKSRQGLTFNHCYHLCYTSPVTSANEAASGLLGEGAKQLLAGFRTETVAVALIDSRAYSRECLRDSFTNTLCVSGSNYATYMHVHQQ